MEIADKSLKEWSLMGDSKLNLQSWENKVFSPADVYWIKVSGKKILLLEKGSYLDFDFLGRYEKFNLIIENEYEGIPSLKNDFEKLKNIEHEKDRVVIARRIVKEFFENFENYKEEDLIILGSEIFFDLPVDDVQILVKAKEDYLARSSLCGLLSVVIALNLGYRSFQFLKDLYHVHYAATKIGGASSDEIDELEKYRTREILRLRENPFKKTPIALSYQFKSFALKQIFKFNFEGKEGYGPFHLNNSELSELEMILTIAQRTVSFHKPFLKKNKIAYSFPKLQERMKNCG